MKYFLFFCHLIIAVSARSQQLKNSGFEKWHLRGDKLYPSHWSVDIHAALYHNPAEVAKRGKNSVVISTWYSYVPGHLFYGNFENPDKVNWSANVVPFKGKPAKLSGYYRYTHSVNADDVAIGEVMLKNASGDTLAFSRLLLDTSTHWKKFEIPLIYRSSGKAAAIAIHFVSCDTRAGMNDDNHPNRLYLDELKLLFKGP